jgi:hypothetical protein
MTCSECENWYLNPKSGKWECGLYNNKKQTFTEWLENIEITPRMIYGIWIIGLIYCAIIIYPYLFP